MPEPKYSFRVDPCAPIGKIRFSDSPAAAADDARRYCVPQAGQPTGGIVMGCRVVLLDASGAEVDDIQLAAKSLHPLHHDSHLASWLSQTAARIEVMAKTAGWHRRG